MPRVEIEYDCEHETCEDGSSGPIRSNGVLPSSNLPGLTSKDNAAIAKCLIKAGTPLVVEGAVIGVSSSDIPEGHRFTVCTVSTGERLTSWGIPFGTALRELPPAEYLCNAKVLATFRERNTELNLPGEPNFMNVPFRSYDIPDDFQPVSESVAGLDSILEKGISHTFDGYHRSGGRGTGTRNFVIVVGVTSDVAGFVRAVAKVSHVDDLAPNISGVVPVAHTEGGVTQLAPAEGQPLPQPTNWDKVLRALAGFVVHPNVGGCLLVDRPHNRLRASHVLDFIKTNALPCNDVTVRTLTLDSTSSVTEQLTSGATLVAELTEAAKSAKREPRPLTELVLAQQCGGSDAFSGISANPLIGHVSRQIVAEGGGVLLAETDELIGAESYVLSRLASRKTGEKFLTLIDRFYKYTTQFGHSPEGNPSGGNLYRGLYNISLKSAGAAMKKSPDVRLDHVIEYAEHMGQRRGYSFMDSPGNDLESIAGQVAAGCNMIVFTTGNGAITNFPFVPTVKVLTTSARFELLSKDMDINAGAYLDGSCTMEQLSANTLDYIVRAASGTKTKGEIAGHHQVNLWREWALLDKSSTDYDNLGPSESAAEISSALDSSVDLGGDGPRLGVPFDARERDSTDAPATQIRSLHLIPTDGSLAHQPDFVTERVGMVVPTSLCSSQVSQMLADRLNATSIPGLSRIVALPHTEGCGNSAGVSENMFVRTILGYTIHPLVSRAVLLEHGCEKTHNNRLSKELQRMGVDPNSFGYASIQLDGGIEGAFEKVKEYFSENTIVAAHPKSVESCHLRIGFAAIDPVPHFVAHAFGLAAQSIVQSGGMVVAAGTVIGAPFMHSLYMDGVDFQEATLGYGQHTSTRGLHTMHSSTKNFSELVTGLGATGVEVIITFVNGSCVEPHPLIPIIQVTHSIKLTDADLVLDEDNAVEESKDALIELIVRIAEHTVLPKLFGAPCTHIQISRGTKGISL